MIPLSFKRLALASLVVVGLSGCADELFVANPNAPTPAVLTSEEGVRRVATGLYVPIDGFITWYAFQYHEGMGDAVPSRVGNFTFVDVVNPERIIYSVPGVPDNTPQQSRGFADQPTVLAQTNTRLNADNPTAFEWTYMYRVVGEANRILQSLENPATTFLGTAAEQDAKKQGFKAWAHFWKGYAYSRIGLLYERGLILDTAGTTNSNYRTPDEMITESNRQLDLAIASSAGIGSIATAVVPDLFGAKPTSASFAQAASTIKARNLLSRRYRSDMTQADWQAVKAAADAGLRSNANTIQVKSDATTYGGTGTLIYRASGLGPTWAYVSQRLIQEFAPGDKRLAFGTTATATSYVRVASTADDLTSSQLASSGTNYFARGNNSLTNGRGLPPVFENVVGAVPTYLVSAEEAMMASAEASLALGQPGDAATMIDAVRTMQGAGLPALAASAVTPELIRRERRVALVGRGLSYYDARRFKITLPVAQGGGRTGAHVWYPVNGGTSFKLDRNATIVYNFRPYWPVPAGEAELNPGVNVTPK